MLAQPHPRAPDGFKSPYDAMEDDTDAATARLVADLLAQDMEAAANFHAAEQMQLQLLLDDSRPGSPASGPAEMVYESNDRVEALRLALDTATASAVEKEQLASTADSNWARQLGQQFEAQRRKAMAPPAPLAAFPAPIAPQPAGKGKGRALVGNSHQHGQPVPAAPPITTCSICLEPVTPTSNPFEASNSAAGSNMVPFGMFLGARDDKHVGCLDCLSQYINSKLDDGLKKAFPINCPECPTEITDNEAGRILGPQALPAWYHRKLIDSTPQLFCPNPVCSERVILPEDDLGTTQAQCPSCRKLMCTKCRSVWHVGYTCAEFQDLPEHSRDAGDLAALHLATKEGWRRCPECRVVVDLKSACGHITCVCSHHWCYQCGKPWDIANVKCTNNPPCNLWEEDRLVEQRDRNAAQPRQVAPLPARDGRPQPARAQPAPLQPQRQVQAPQQRDQHAARAGPQPPRAVVPAVRPLDYNLYADLEAQHVAQMEARRYRTMEVNRIEERRAALSRGALDWMENGGPMPQLGTHSHAFTQDFVHRHLCRYCNYQAHSLPALKEHFMEASHGVYSCCERFFRRGQDLDRHVDASPEKHHHSVELEHGRDVFQF